MEMRFDAPPAQRPAAVPVEQAAPDVRWGEDGRVDWVRTMTAWLGGYDETVERALRLGNASAVGVPDEAAPVPARRRSNR